MAMRRSARFPQIPTGDVVGSFETYERAQGAVDQLARADFPLSEVAILGSNLKSVERVTGKMNAGRAALSGLMSGVFLGLFVGLLVMFVTPQVSLLTLGSVMLVAIGFSVIWNLVLFAVSPGKKEFTSVMQILASHFDVVVTPMHAAQARQILGDLPVVPQPTPITPGQASANETPRSPEPAGDAAPAEDPSAPATPPRTYGEAQDALRREAEQRAREARGGAAAGASGETDAGATGAPEAREYTAPDAYRAPTQRDSTTE